MFLRGHKAVQELPCGPFSQPNMKERQSNMELLRIVSMAMVVGVHLDGASLGLPRLDGDWTAATAGDWWRIIVEALTITGVNCFTMISGYFGIRLSWRSLGRFLGICLLYSVGIYTLFACAGGFAAPYSWKGWAESWLVLTHSDLWYVPAYFLLMLCAPVLNVGLNALAQNEFRWLLVGGAFATVWMGWAWEMPFNPTGHTICQLVFTYAIARYIARFNAWRLRPLAALALFLAASALIACDAVYQPLKAYSYNSPLVLVASVAMFLMFRGMSFQSRWVNELAKSAFSVYLIHKNPLVWVNIVKPTAVAAWSAMNPLEYTAFFIAAIVAAYLACAVIDTMRRTALRF